MLTITTEEINNDYSPLWRFECPECGKPINFYSIANIECIHCNNKFPFIPGHLIKNKEARIKYHIAILGENSINNI